MPTGGTLAELPMLRPCGKLGDSSKLTPRRLPPCDGRDGFESPRRGFNAYPEAMSCVGQERSPAAPMNLTPRPPAEAPEGRAGRRRAGAAHGHLQSGHGTPEEKKSSTSLPPVPLTARESHREREDLGGSGSSITSGPASARNGSGSRSGSRGLAPKEKGKPPMPKAPSPHEASSRASSSQGYSRPSSGAAAFLEMLAMDVELTSRETLEVDLQPNPLDFSAELGRAYGAVEAPQVPNCFEEVVGEMEREKDLWHEKTLALLSSLTLTTAPTSSASSTALERTVAPTSASPVQPLAGDGGAAEGGGHGEGGKALLRKLCVMLVWIRTRP
eukprot:symbB.v1.2.005653.t1/scaffold327.1/size259883/6